MIDTADVSTVFWALIAVVAVACIVGPLLTVVHESLSDDDDERERLNKVMASKG